MKALDYNGDEQKVWAGFWKQLPGRRRRSHPAAKPAAPRPTPRARPRDPAGQARGGGVRACALRRPGAASGTEGAGPGGSQESPPPPPGVRRRRDNGCASPPGPGPAPGPPSRAAPRGPRRRRPGAQLAGATMPRWSRRRGAGTGTRAPSRRLRAGRRTPGSRAPSARPCPPRAAPAGGPAPSQPRRPPGPAWGGAWPRCAGRWACGAPGAGGAGPRR